MPTPISEQRRMEEALRESEAKFRALFNRANDAIFMLLDGIYVDCNVKGQEMYGRTRDQILGRMPDDFSPPTQPDGRDSQEKGLAIFHKVLAGEAQFFEWLSQLPDGTPLHTEVSLNRLQLADKIYIQAIVRDITGRKLAEENNVRSLALLRATLDSTADGILTIGQDRQILSFNETFVRMWRIPIHILTSNDDNLAIQFVLDQLLAPEQFIAKVRYLYEHPLEESFDVLDFKDGRIFERFSRPMLVEGEAIGRVWSFRDITERKRAGERIAEQVELLDKARDAIIVRAIDGKILFWNKGAERVYGWTRDEVIGRTVVQILHTPKNKFEEINSHVLSEGEWYGELQHLAKDGRELIIESRGTLIRDAEGKPKSVLAINTDITEKKKIEAQFMRAQRMESIGTLAGGIAHDLNNILAPIMMSIDVLKLTATDRQAKRVLETIEGNAKRGADIVRQVLSFARGVEGERIEVDLEELVKDVEIIIKDTFPKNIRLELCHPDRPWKILGDPTQLHQILLNLCLNARDAMPRGGRLCLKAENIVLDEAFAEQQPEARPGRYIIISVGDSGTGIPSAVLDKIFEPFFTTKEMGKGTGLGLSTVLAIVKSHGGFVNVESRLDQGTTIKVYFPAMESSPEARKRVATLPGLPRGNSETVLIIDDESSVLAVTSETLEAFGYRTLTARDGAEGVALYQKHRDEISVVLTDMAMPVMDGLATIQAIRKINPKAKIIAASGSETSERLTRESEAEIEHFLSKPFTAGTLLKALRTILAKT